MKTELFSGAATASVPFIVPPGPNGFLPILGLRYNAQAGNSWVGRGRLLGVPSVERMTKYGTPSYSDDPNTGDHFALSDDRLVRDDAGFYHATRENFARIERADVGGVIDHWIVRFTNGETRWFGATADSRIVNGQRKKLSWLLDRAEDANGNFINYSYYTTATTGDDGQPYQPSTGGGTARVALIAPDAFVVPDDGGSKFGTLGPLIEIAFTKLAPFGASHFQIQNLIVTTPDATTRENQSNQTSMHAFQLTVIRG